MLDFPEGGQGGVEFVNISGNFCATLTKGFPVYEGLLTDFFEDGVCVLFHGLDLDLGHVEGIYI